MVLMYPRTVRVRSSSGTVNEYVRVVEAYREDGKVKQRVVAQGDCTVNYAPNSTCSK